MDEQLFREGKFSLPFWSPTVRHVSYFLFTIFQNVNIRTHGAVFAQIDMLTIELRPQKNLHAVQDQLFCFLFVL